MVLDKNKPVGVEGGWRWTLMSSLNGSIIHEAALVTSAPIRRLTPTILCGGSDLERVWFKKKKKRPSFEKLQGTSQ